MSLVVSKSQRTFTVQLTTTPQGITLKFLKMSKKTISVPVDVMEYRDLEASSKHFARITLALYFETWAEREFSDDERFNIYSNEERLLAAFEDYFAQRDWLFVKSGRRLTDVLDMV
jgi:hypothetical protein